MCNVYCSFFTYIQFVCLTLIHFSEKKNSNLINGNFHNEQVRPKIIIISAHTSAISTSVTERKKIISTNQNLNVRINLTGKVVKNKFYLLSGQHQGEMEQSDKERK